MASNCQLCKNLGKLTCDNCSVCQHKAKPLGQGIYSNESIENLLEREYQTIDSQMRNFLKNKSVGEIIDNCTEHFNKASEIIQIFKKYGKEPDIEFVELRRNSPLSVVFQSIGLGTIAGGIGGACALGLESALSSYFGTTVAMAASTNPVGWCLFGVGILAVAGAAYIGYGQGQNDEAQRIKQLINEQMRQQTNPPAIPPVFIIPDNPGNANIKTGATLVSASAGAAIGTAIFPGVGTAIGGAVGATLGWLFT